MHSLKYDVQIVHSCSIWRQAFVNIVLDDVALDDKDRRRDIASGVEAMKEVLA